MNIIELATKLVGFPTISETHSNLEMASFISNYLSGYGFAIKEFPYVSDGNGLKKVSIIATKGPQDQIPILALSGHMDTVPPGNQWNHSEDPFRLIPKKNGSIDVYQGLGIADMKLFIAIAMKVGEKIKTSDLNAPLALCFTSDEEIGCVGAKRLLVDNGRIADYVVVGEPTEMIPRHLHKGYIYIAVRLGAYKEKHSKHSGDTKENPSHSSNPHTTTNVVEKYLPAIIKALSEFKTRLEACPDPRFDPPYPTMNIGGNIQIGRFKDRKSTSVDKIAKNIVPRGFRVICDLRPIPGQDPENLLELLSSVLRNSVSKIEPEVSDEKIELKVDLVRRPGDPMETPTTSQIVRLAEEISGNGSIPVSFNTEGGIFNKSGSESVIWGPASINEAHKDNEYAAAKYFQPEIVTDYIRLIDKLCGKER